MPSKPQFNYFLYSSDKLVLKNSARWDSILPLDRNMLGKKCDNEPESTFKVGDYFESIRTFLTRQGIDSIAAYASKISGTSISKSTIKTFNIYLEKHGEFYHPARIETELYGRTLSFVLNVAVSNSGRHLAKTEFDLLRKLNTRHSPSFLPEMFCLGEISTKKNQNISMFLGEWFEDFHEFHLSFDSKTGKNRMLVWAPGGSFFLSEKQTAELYRQAATIFTVYYSIDTFEQIVSWHHAAGDFVIHTMGNGVSVKLITIRNYSSIFRGDRLSGIGDDTASILDALLIFFLNMSIRMRLDRLDGVGDFIWSDNSAVENCLLGFYEGLKPKYHKELQKGFADTYFKDYLARFSHSILYEMCISIVDRLYQNDKEIDTIQNNLKEHIHILHSAIHLIAKSNKKTA